MNAAGLVVQSSAQAIDERALARSIRSDQPKPLARGDVEIDTVERDEAAEALAQIDDLEQRLAHDPSTLTRRRPTISSTGLCRMCFCTSPTMPFGATITNPTSSNPTS